jgi:hypothetical protein
MCAATGRVGTDRTLDVALLAFVALGLCLLMPVQPRTSRRPGRPLVAPSDVADPVQLKSFPRLGSAERGEHFGRCADLSPATPLLPADTIRSLSGRRSAGSTATIDAAAIVLHPTCHDLVKLFLRGIDENDVDHRSR